MEQGQYRAKSVQQKTLGKTISICCLVLIAIDCFLFAIHLLNRDLMVSVIVITTIALMTGLTISGRVTK